MISSKDRIFNLMGVGEHKYESGLFDLYRNKLRSHVEMVNETRLPKMTLTYRLGGGSRSQYRWKDLR